MLQLTAAAIGKIGAWRFGPMGGGLDNPGQPSFEMAVMALLDRAADELAGYNPGNHPGPAIRAPADSPAVIDEFFYSYLAHWR